MKRILVARHAHLGDIILTFPALSDIHAAMGQEVAIDMVVEEGLEAFPRMHKAIDKVILTAHRRWRKELRNSSFVEFYKYMRDLREREYLAVFDFQDKINTALLSAVPARGPVHAPDRESSFRRRSASFLYDKLHRLPVDELNILRNRELCAKALGYTIPAGPLDYGILKGGGENRHNEILFVTHASFDRKLWQEEKWIELGQTLHKDGMQITLTWGKHQEYERAMRIANRFDGEIAPRMVGDVLFDYISRFGGMVSLDTGLAHVGAAVGVPNVCLFVSSPMKTWAPYGFKQVSIDQASDVSARYVYDTLVKLLARPDIPRIIHQ